MEVETGGVCLQARDHQGRPTSPETRRRQRAASPLQPPAGTGPATSYILDFWHPEL